MRNLFFKFVLLTITALLQIACNPKSETIIESANESKIAPTIVEKTKAVLENPMDVDYFQHIKPEHKEVLRNWLKTKSFLRPGVEQIDNKTFNDNIKFVRETVGESGNQYYSVGDFNKDKKVDFAVLLVDNRKNENSYVRFSLAIFNAPFVKRQKPNYYEEKLEGISNSYISFNKMIKNHLFLGKFESDVYCATYYSKGNSYRFEDCL